MGPLTFKLSSIWWNGDPEPEPIDLSPVVLATVDHRGDGATLDTTWDGIPAPPGTYATSRTARPPTGAGPSDCTASNGFSGQIDVALPDPPNRPQQQIHARGTRHNCQTGFRSAAELRGIAHNAGTERQ